MQYLTHYKVLLPLIFTVFLLFSCNESKVTVKGPVFSVEVILSEKAENKLATLNEKVIINNMFSGVRAIPLKDAEDPNIIDFYDNETEINNDKTVYFESIVFNKDKFEKIKNNGSKEREYELNINVYSARRGDENNLLTCSTLIEDAWLINNMHIRIWCSLIDEPRSLMKSEIIGKEKAKYDNALQNCFDQYGIMNNTVLASCKEEVSGEFRGTEKEYLQAPKLEGLVDIVGRYERQGDQWDFSLNESSGFHLIHSQRNKEDEIFIADRLEFIEGSRYSIYVEGQYGETDSKWALIFNPKTKHYDLEVKHYDKASNKWKHLIFPARY